MHTYTNMASNLKRPFKADIENEIRIGHVNIYHLYNKLIDINMLLNEQPFMHLLGISESRLN